MIAQTTIFNLRGEPTPFELEQIREVDALIQYQSGKWASTPREKIPAHVIAAALEVYDPTLPLKFRHGTNDGGKGKPGARAKNGRWLRRKQWVCSYLRAEDSVAAKELKEAILKEWEVAHKSTARGKNIDGNRLLEA